MSESLASMIAAARSVANEVPPDAAREALDDAAVKFVVDVREPEEFREGHVPDSVNIPRGLLEIRADPASPSADASLSTERSARVLVYCTKGPGARSLFAARTLMDMGYENVDVLAGGLNAWAEAGLPVERSMAG